jgi:hypothetical protein
MCVLCDGGTLEDVCNGLHQQIVERGYALCPVVGPVPEQGWVYTIGLVDNFNHPELAAVAVRMNDGIGAVDAVAQLVKSGQRFEPGTSSRVCGVELAFLDVDAAHIRRGLINSWFLYYEHVCRWNLEPEVTQVVLPAGGACHQHQDSQPRLDDPKPVSFVLSYSWRDPAASQKARRRPR